MMNKIMNKLYVPCENCGELHDYELGYEEGYEEGYNAAIEEYALMKNTDNTRKGTIKMKDKEYNGWKNRQTWNVMLWLGNDEFLYGLVVKFMQTYKGKCPYAHFIRSIGYENERTPDNIKWLSTRLDYKELNEAMVELKGDN